MKRILFQVAISFFALLIGVGGASYWFNNYHLDNEVTPVKPPVIEEVKSHFAEEADAIEAVLRYQLDANRQEKVCFITVEGQEPDEAFLNRFAGQTDPRIQRSAYKSRDNYDRIIDLTTGETAEVISIVSIKWLNELEAEVHTNFYDGDVGEYTQKVVKKNGKWIALNGIYLDEMPHRPFLTKSK